MNLNFSKLALAFALSLSLAPHTTTAAEKPTTIEVAKKERFYGDVVLVRGGLNAFSRGLDQMAAQLRKKGVKTTIISYRNISAAGDQILKNRKRYGRKPIILIGHSFGANAIIDLAERLGKKRIRVSYMATFAATNPSPIPSNVRKITNYYFKTDGWGKPLQKGKGFRGRMKNIDFSNKKSIGHFNIEKQPRLQRQVVNNVIRFLRIRKSS